MKLLYNELREHFSCSELPNLTVDASTQDKKILEEKAKEIFDYLLSHKELLELITTLLQNGPIIIQFDKEALSDANVRIIYLANDFVPTLQSAAISLKQQLYYLRLSDIQELLNKIKMDQAILKLMQNSSTGTGVENVMMSLTIGEPKNKLKNKTQISKDIEAKIKKLEEEQNKIQGKIKALGEQLEKEKTKQKDSKKQKDSDKALVYSYSSQNPDELSEALLTPEERRGGEQKMVEFF